MADRAIGVLLAIIGLASLAVILSKKSNTVKVVGAFLSGFSGLVKAAVSPVTAK